MGNLPKGGSFLFGQTDPQDIFTPEDFTEEHKMIYKTAMGFVKDNVLTVMDDLEYKKDGLNKKLLMEAGELGLLGTDVPEEYEGFAMDKISTSIIAECMGWAGGFAMTHGGQTGIGQLPIVYFGTHEQKRKYLPGIVMGEIATAYALTEPGAGTDAMAISTSAVLSPDGKYYILNGAKQFITNAAFADVFIVFAKIDREKFTGFIVDANSEGLSTGPEEHKMGIKGSSTRTLILEDVKVPVENILYEIGKGYVIAFNILNMGRYKLAGNATGIAKQALELAASFANERIQFGKPIAEFGLIKEKLAETAVRTYVAESMVYRTGGLLDEMMHSLDISGHDGGQVAARGIEEYAMECSMNKVFATEVQAFAVDEGVQIHGGYGFTSEYPIERLYRDARIYRIFEGTNEINRVVTTSTLVRRGLKGDIPLKEAIEQVQSKIAAGMAACQSEEDLVQAAKDIFLYTLGAGINKFGNGLLSQQEVIGKLADMLTQVFGMESALLRAQKALARDGADKAELKLSMAKCFIHSNIGMMEQAAKNILATVAEGEELTKRISDLELLAQYTPQSTILMRQGIAAVVSAAGKYVV
ncbi:acyl-CoA dehydrogenase family protein [Desulfotomaculum sp. 1211_IL3151]|uniref:acyl-CoA dehydrogenase family protein n=1 Tax=Desulfotomaculum sp. 1211_IL3151 TaxID=3084055 RepID=UPI002FDB3225